MMKVRECGAEANRQVLSGGKAKTEKFTTTTSPLLTPTFYADLSARKPYAVFPINGSGPKVSAARTLLNLDKETARR
jgi:hypothetical protein